jgi:hypothetical protein
MKPVLILAAILLPCALALIDTQITDRMRAVIRFMVTALR